MPKMSRDTPLAEELRAHLRSELSGRALDRAEELLSKLCEGASDEPADFPGRPDPDRASDSVIIAMDASPNSARGQAATRIAIERVGAHVGRDTVLACDSAEAVYRTGLRALGVSDAGRIHRDALESVFAAHVRARRADRDSNTAALDRSVGSGTTEGFARLFPNASRIRQI